MKGNRFLNSLDHYDAFTTIIIGFIAFLTSFSFIILNLFFKEARKFPSILLTIISFGELIMSVHWIMTGFYSQYILKIHYVDPSGLFCKISGTLITFGASIQYLFQLSFLFTIIIMFRNALTKMKHKNLYVIIPSILTIASMTNFMLTGSIGKDFFGICTIEHSTMGNIIFTAVLLGIYIVVVTVTLVILKKFKTKTQKILMIKNSDEFYVFYKNYAIFMLFYYIISAGGHIISSQFKTYLDYKNGECGSTCMKLYFMCRLLCNFKLYLPIVSFMLRISDPYLKNIIQDYLKKKKKSFHRHLLDESMMVFNETSTYLFNKSSFTVDSKDIMLNRTLNRIKMNCTKTILISLHAYYRVIFQSITNTLRDMDSVFISNLEFEVVQLLEIHKDFCKKNKRKIEENNSIKEFSLKSANSFDNPTLQTPIKNEISLDLNIFPEYLTGKVNIYFAKEFAHIMMERNYIISEIFNSFDEDLNRKNINRTGSKKGNKSGNGGASGEFFFITFDNKFIIKTIPQEEEIIFGQIIENYTSHVTKNPNSLLGLSLIHI